MNKEEILEKSRLENKEEDERENSIRKNSFIPFIIGFGVISIFFIIFDGIFFEHDFIAISIATTLVFAAAIQMWYLTFTIRKKVWTCLMASLFTLQFILEILNFISEVKKFI